MSETTIVFQHCELCANYSVRDSLFDIITNVKNNLLVEFYANYE